MVFELNFDLTVGKSEGLFVFDVYVFEVLRVGGINGSSLGVWDVCCGL